MRRRKKQGLTPLSPTSPVTVVVQWMLYPPAPLLSYPSRRKRCGDIGAGKHALDALEDRSEALPATNAHCLQTITRLTSLHLMQHGCQDTCARRANRVAQ